MAYLSSMLKKINITDTFSHASNCFVIMLSAYGFFMENKLWKGFFRHKWIAFATIAISLLFSYWLICDVSDYLFSTPVPSENINEAGIIGDGISEESKQAHASAAISGGSKYLLMIILEIVIFYFSVKTIEILTQEEQTAKVSQFWNAEIRMIKVLIRGFVQALVVQICLSIVLGIFGISSSIKEFLMFFVYAFFLGHAFFDNYNELYNIKITTSEDITKSHFGATLALGTIASLLLLIPLIGAIVTPIFAALTANIYGHKYYNQDKVTENTLVA